jgi:biopolymer transport protein ExbB/TolQ
MESREPNLAGPAAAPGPTDSPQAPGSSAPGAPQASRRGPLLGQDNLDLLKALFLGVFATALFYEVFPLPFIDDKRIAVIFTNWVSETIVGMSLWSLFVLMFKSREHGRERAALRAFTARESVALFRGGINSRNAGAVFAQLTAHLTRNKVRRFAESVIFRRVGRILHHVSAVPGKAGVNELLDYQAQIDLKRLDSSYAVLNVFLWAIPILGFIGTVMGIAQAVNEFADFIQTAEAGAQFNAQMRTALGGVTNGLAVAFNTTFIALVLVIPVMVIASLLQKSQEELLLAIEEFCLEELVPRLSFVAGADLVAETFEEHLHRIQQLSQTWLGQFEPLMRSLSLQVDMIRHQLSGIQPLIQEFTDRLIDSPGSPAGPGARRGPRDSDPS